MYPLLVIKSAESEQRKLAFICQLKSQQLKSRLLFRLFTNRLITPATERYRKSPDTGWTELISIIVSQVVVPFIYLITTGIPLRWSYARSHTIQGAVITNRTSQRSLTPPALLSGQYIFNRHAAQQGERKVGIEPMTPALSCRGSPYSRIILYIQTDSYIVQTGTGNIIQH